MARYLRGIRHLWLVSLLALAAGSPVRGVDLAKETGLQFAPQDADFYLGNLKLGDQWKRFVSSKFVGELMKVPYVQRVKEKFLDQWNGREGEVGRFRDGIENPQAESLLRLGKDMFSEEIFLLGDARNSEFLLEVNSLAEGIVELISKSEGEEAVDYFLNIPKSDFDAIPIPMLVAGFKISNQDALLNKLDELDAVVRFGLGAFPPAQPLLNGLERVEDTKGTRLAWTLKSEMIPWDLIDQLGPNASEAQTAALAKIQDILEGRQVCFTIGALKDYFILAVSEDADDIEQLGAAEGLAAHPAMKPLMDRASEAVTAIAYTSDALADAQFETQFNNYFTKQLGPMYHQAERQYGQIPSEWQSIPDDLAWIDEQIAEHVPEWKGNTAFSFYGKDGLETWNYSRTEDVVFDASQPLSILNHVGGDPMMMLAFRLQDHPEYFATAREIVRKIKPYLDLAPELDILSVEDQEKWEVFLEKGWPVIADLADLWEDEFMPAMKDGQHAWVLGGGNLEAKQWWKGMPESSKPLPLPESATITGLSSKDQMVEAFRRLFDVFDDSLEFAREISTKEFPSSYSIPRPSSADASVGSRWIYPIPDDCPVPKTMAPQALLTDDFMVASYSDKQSDALAGSKSPTIGQGVFSAKQACSSAAYIDLGRLVRFLKPWVVYAIETQRGDLDAVLVEEEPTTPELKGTDIVQIWEALGSLGRAASVSTAGPDGSRITRSVFSE